MAQRISRAKRTVSGQPFAQPGDVAVVLRVLYLIFNEGYSGRVDLSAEAIRLARQLTLACDEPEVAGLLALMLLHHARRGARTDEHGTLIPLDKQDRTRWNEAEIAEGVRILQAALARDRRGEYQIQAAIAALHDDARTAGETDWPQILAWYDELLELTDNPVAALSRAIAVGEVDGPLAGLSAVEKLATRLGNHHRLDAEVPACTSGPGTSTSPPGTTPARRPGHAAPPSATTSPSKRPDCATGDRHELRPRT